MCRPHGLRCRTRVRREDGLRVLGFDPGVTRAGFGVAEDAGGRLRAIAFGTLHAEGDGTPEQLASLRRRVDAVIAGHQPAVLAIERVFFNKNVRTAARTLQASGVVQALAAERGLPVFEYGPLEVKSALVGVGNASKQQVQFMVRRVLGFAEDITEPDAADALALAVCALHGRPWLVASRLERLSQGARR